jgi:hypothetical protein
MVLHVSYGKTSVLPEGDAEKAAERRITSLHQPQADLLKVGHHGSAPSTTPEILQSSKANRRPDLGRLSATPRAPSTATPSQLGRQFFRRVVILGGGIGRRLPRFRDQATRLLHILFPHQDDHPAQARKGFL